MKKYIAPTIDVIPMAGDEPLAKGATSWMTPDGETLPVEEGNPTETDAKPAPGTTKGAWEGGWDSWD